MVCAHARRSCARACARGIARVRGWGCMREAWRCMWQVGWRVEWYSAQQTECNAHAVEEPTPCNQYMHTYIHRHTHTHTHTHAEHKSMHTSKQLHKHICDAHVQTRQVLVLCAGGSPQIMVARALKPWQPEPSNHDSPSQTPVVSSRYIRPTKKRRGHLPPI